jgi:hypothetical protein
MILLPGLSTHFTADIMIFNGGHYGRTLSVDIFHRETLTLFIYICHGGHDTFHNWHRQEGKCRWYRHFNKMKTQLGNNVFQIQHK